MGRTLARFSFTLNEDDEADDEGEKGEVAPPSGDLSGKQVLVRDGLANDMELLHKAAGKRCPKLGKTTCRHYPCNILPSAMVEGTVYRVILAT